MKTKISLLILLFSLIGFAQNGINYKAVIKDDLGNVVANQNIDIRFTILQGAINSYQETHDVTTDSNGIIIVNIGEGTLVSGNFSTLVWGNGVFSLRSEIDLEQNGSYDIEETTAFKSVPYALTANKALTTQQVDLPYYDETSESGAAFHVQNDFSNGRYGIAGSVGTGAETLPSNNAGVFGQGVEGHGVYGVAKTSFFAGVQGVSESSTGVGVQGYGIGGGVGGHFYTTSSGQAALTTGLGNVGIGIEEPEMKMHVGGDLFIQTNLGDLVMGFPNNGNQWQLSTRNQGADWQFQSKESGSNTFLTKFRMRQDGEFQVGDISTLDAWVHIKQNSSIIKQHILLEEEGTDYARLGFTNTSTDGNWDIAGLPSTTAENARLNFYFRNSSGAGNKMVVTGDGRVGINGTPTGGRLQIFQGGQASNSGIRFTDGTANQDWDIRHGFGLSFIYGGSLRATISAVNGAYIQASDIRLKDNINQLNPVLDKILKLRPKTYYYKSDDSKTETIGLIAQEVQKILPEVVQYSKVDDLFGVDYAAFGVIAIKAIQEQQVLIENQQKQIDELKTLVTTLINKQ